MMDELPEKATVETVEDLRGVRVISYVADSELFVSAKLSASELSQLRGNLQLFAILLPFSTLSNWHLARPASVSRGYIGELPHEVAKRNHASSSSKGCLLYSWLSMIRMLSAKNVNLDQH